MIRSMTGYGRSEETWRTKSLVVEIKSLNHRNLEIAVRLSAGFSALEVMIKKRIAERVARGRVEVSLRLETEQQSDAGGALTVDLPLIRDYYRALEEIREELGLPDPITLEMVTSIKNGIYATEPEYTDQDARTAIERCVDRALAVLIDMKEREGEELYRDFLSRIDLVKRHRDMLESRAPRVVLEYRARLAERLKELTEGTKLDETRIAQEIAIMAEKTDITEELVRLDSHLNQFRELLYSDEPVGRQLDFIVQEMHREINTIGSKSGDIDIARTVIEIKTELAKLREQAQNIE